MWHMLYVRDGVKDNWVRVQIAANTQDLGVGQQLYRRYLVAKYDSGMASIDAMLGTRTAARKYSEEELPPTAPMDEVWRLSTEIIKRQLKEDDHG